MANDQEQYDNYLKSKADEQGLTVSDLFDKDESPEQIESARLDAEVDEACDHEEGMSALSIGFVGSFMVENIDTGEREHGVLRCLANTYEEAVGGFYLDLVNDYPSEDGWYPPSVIVSSEPIIFMDENLFPCPTCGNPEGQCEEPGICPHNAKPI